MSDGRETTRSTQESVTFIGGYVTGIEDQDPTPDAFALQGNYPSPFSSTTRIRFQLPIAAELSVRVWDVLGREVALLLDGPTPAGQGEVTFHAAGLPSGMYFVVMEVAGFRATRPLVLAK